MMAVIRSFALPAVAAGLVLALGAPVSAQGPQVSTPFSGAKVNGGTATLARSGSTFTLGVSDDFKVPDTPDPHWQVVDSKGNTFLLQRFGIKGDKVNRRITLPAYVTDVVKVQVYCAWAEALLGEASFSTPQTTN